MSKISTTTTKQSYYYLFIDTETNGATKNGRWTYDQAVIDLGYCITDKNYNIIKSKSKLIKDVATKIYPKQKLYTLNKIKTKGVEWESQFIELLNDVKQINKMGGKIFAHNIEFDIRVIEWSCKLKNISDNLINEFVNILDTRGWCTMKNTIKWCECLPFRYGEYKYPKLEEFYYKATGQILIQPHTAIDDVLALIHAYKKYIKIIS